MFKRRKSLRLALIAIPFVSLPVSFAAMCEEPEKPILVTDDGIKYVEYENSVAIMGFSGLTEVVIPSEIKGKPVASFGYERTVFMGRIHVKCDGTGITKLTLNSEIEVIKAHFPNLSTIELVDPLSHASESGFMIFNGPPNNDYTTVRGIPIGIDYDLFIGTTVLSTIKLSVGSLNNVKRESSNFIYIVSYPNVEYILPSNILSAPDLVIATKYSEVRDTWEDNWSGDNKVTLGISYYDFLLGTLTK